MLQYKVTVLFIKIREENLILKHQNKKRDEIKKRKFKYLCYSKQMNLRERTNRRKIEGYCNSYFTTTTTTKLVFRNYEI